VTGAGRCGALALDTWGATSAAVAPTNKAASPRRARRSRPVRLGRAGLTR